MNAKNAKVWRANVRDEEEKHLSEVLQESDMLKDYLQEVIAHDL